MSKNKTSQTSEVQETKKKPAKKMSKKEKKELAQQHAKEMNQKKMRNYAFGFVVSLIAVAVSFLSGAEVGTATWSYTQIGCYLLMGFAGIFLKRGAKYELNQKRAKNMDIVGLIFIVICLGMVMAETIALIV